jgi:SWI/SNF-related matrix-associated actin-dependent regulator of chromatin subfamily A member 5
VRYPMQELELNYPTTKGKVYSEEEDRYLLCRLHHYGMGADDVYEQIKRDITEFPVFRFDWFFKSRSPQELQRRCNTLLGMIEKEAESRAEDTKKNGTVVSSAPRGKVRYVFRHEVPSADSPCRSAASMRSRRKSPARRRPRARPGRGVSARRRRRRHKLAGCIHVLLTVSSHSLHISIY